MTTNRRRSLRRVKIPIKFGDTICSLNNKMNDQLAESDDQLENGEIMDDSKEIGEKARVSDTDEVELNDNMETEGLRCDMGMENDSQDTSLPTVINEIGQEFVIFDDELVMEGSKKWEMSACGYFVGYRMSMQELSYHLYRMWGNFSLKHILNNDNDIFVFKFNNAQGLQTVIESGPWIVNNKPVVVQKWDPSINLDRIEPTRLPVWIKLINISLEAWTHRGLSALASRVGKPLIMDAMTTKMCNEGLGSLRYARILIEANATKGLVDFMEILYLNKQNGEQYVKKVKVEYDWKPQICPQCLVFGHSGVNCPKKEKEIKKSKEVNEEIDGFVNVKSRKSKDDGIKSNNIGIGRNMQQNNQKKPFQKKKVVSKFVYRQKQAQGLNIEQMKKVNEEHDKYNTPSGSKRKVWSVGENVIKDVRDTANKFSVLQEIEEESTMMKMNLREKSMVEKFVKEKIQPSINEAKDWTKEMIEYFKECWKEHYDKSKEVENEGTDIELDENDVYIEKEGIAKFMTENEVRVVETHMKNNRIKKLCMNVFGRWNWQTNMLHSKKGCRIAIGWNANNVNCSMLHNSGQSMLYHVEILSSQKSFFCTFIYAANREKDRRELWKDLRLYKKIVGDLAWAIMGDVNVSLNLEDHSEGISHFTQDMLEFQDCINEIKMEDINWSGMHFTWTKSLNNPNATLLKKIDRVMGNLSFLTHFSSANAIFLPYGISDHSPTILTIPQVMKKKNKSFRMTNYITDKVGFKDLVKENWNMEVVITLKKQKLYDVQAKIDKDPFNKILRQEGVQVLSDYKEAISDEEKLLRRRAKITWLKEGGFLGISPEVAKFSEVDSLLFKKKVSSEDAELMIKEISNDEIKKALFDIEDNKALGHDGFTSRFFNKSWEIIKDDFCAAIKEFFESRKLLGEINATIIALVPKSTTPQKVSDFRPIACCNVTYKCISKILTNRIKNALSHIVDDNQSAFIPGKAITDNILLVQELLKGYNCANDDLIMLCHGGVESVQTIKRALDKFSSMTDLYLNLGKCIMFCGSLDNDTKNAISTILSFKEVFLLPKSVINDIEKLFKRFLWNNGESCNGKVKVAWMDVSKKESLWVKWINVVKFKIRSVWDVAIDLKDSRGWKCILNLRNMVGEHMRFKIGNGKSVNVWHDKWNSEWSLASKISKKEIFYAGFKDHDCIADMKDAKGWKWPTDWMSKYPWLKDVKDLVLNDCPDKPIWVDNDGNSRNFSTAVVWKDIRGNGVSVDWKDIVWHTNCIPKHTFILWLAVKKKLSTQDRMSKWYPNKKIWKKVCDIGRITVNEDNWENIIKAMSLKKNKMSIWGIIRKICLAAVVYYIWQERNGRLFNNHKRTEKEVFEAIYGDVRSILISIPARDTQNIAKVDEEWDIKFAKKI
ncbi:RNA-directed DNA polymerase, eukaryota, reverse transcriptase zinc-binding domain protein [Tanacetum coccineum]